MPRRTSAKNRKLRKGSSLAAALCAPEPQCDACDQQASADQPLASTSQFSTALLPYDDDPGPGKETSTSGKPGRVSVRQLPVRIVFPSTLPIAPQEIHMVLAALGPNLAALFERDG